MSNNNNNNNNNNNRGRKRRRTDDNGDDRGLVAPYTRTPPGPYNPNMRRGNYFKPEIKTFDVTTGKKSLALNEKYDVLNGSLVAIASGTGYNQRVGVDVKVTKVNYKFYCGHDGTNAVADTPYHSKFVRLLIVQDKQSNSTVPPLTDILEMNPTYGAFMSFNKVTNFDRFRILRNELVTLNEMHYVKNSDNTWSCSPAFGYAEGTIKFKKPLVVRYPSGAGNEPIRNNLMAFFIVGASTSTPRIWGALATRVRYSDF